MTKRSTNNDQFPPQVSDSETILSVIARHVDERPDHELFRWVNKQGSVSDSVSYKELWDKSCAVAQLLQAKDDLQKGDRVMIVYPFGLDFLSGLMGCMMVGVTACSVYPPNPKKLKTDLPAFNLKVKDAGAKYALTTLVFRRVMGLSKLMGHKSKVTWLAADRDRSPSSDWRAPEVGVCSPDDIAFIQYTSGSTGCPKGVMISQRSLVCNAHLCSVTCNALSNADPHKRSAFTTVSWMPQYHDMGLIGFFFMVIYSGTKGVVCSPIDFILDPILWHKMMINYNARATLGPNFAFGLLVKRLEAQQQTIEQWTSVDRVVCAAEPVNPHVMEQVMNVLGVPPTSLYVGYGLAEVGLAVCFSPYSVSDGLVACGDLQEDDKTIRIVNDQGQEVADGSIGEVFVQSPNQVAMGYWGNPELSLRTFSRQIESREGNWLATGDLGKVENNKVYIAGRKKELIIVNGRNVYPHDIERLLESEFPNIVRPGSTVAFQNSDTDVGIALEIRNTIKNLDEVSSAFSETSIQCLVRDTFEVNIGTIMLLKQGSIPKTTSGKLKRVEARRISVADSWSADSLLKSVTTSSCLTLECETYVEGEVEAETTIKSVVGHDIDMRASWESNGLTSLLQAELITRVQEAHQMILPVTFQQTCPTPYALKVLIENSSSTLFPCKTHDGLDSPRRWKNSCKSLSSPFLRCLQAIGILLLLLVFVVCLVPPYYIGKYTIQLATTFGIGDSGRHVTMSWLPVVVPSFFVTFSFAVVLLKWLVVGRYQSCVVDLPSVSYLRWWFIDRLVDLWERWVGGFIVDTKLIWVFYRLLGARLAWSCDVKSFIREFDLVEVGSNTSIEHQLRCRKFLQWNEGNPSLVFRPITVGNDCVIKGMLGPGVNLGASSKVAVFSALPAGSQVAEGTLVKGSPAFNAGSYDGVEEKHGYWFVEVLKVGWLVVEVYLFFGLLLLSQICLNQQLSDDWRHTPLVYWILMLLLTSMFGVLVSIVLKWALIGRRLPGEGDFNPWRRVSRWCCDYHYSVVTMTLVPLLGMSRVWNIILLLHGLDIDLISMPGASLATFRPSKVDLVRIRRSFLSNMLIDSDNDYVEIVDSSLGFNVHIGQGVCGSSKVCGG